MKVEVYRGSDGRWRWRLKASNGRIMGDSGQGYRSKWWTKRAARKTHPGVRIVEV